MRKKFSLILMSLILGACGGTENVGDKLSQEELDYLRTRAIAQCEADTEDDLQNFIKTSNNAFGTSDYYRNKTWKYEFKEGTGSASTSATISSWKQDNNNLYFLIISQSGTSETLQFLKISKAVNQAMFEKLRELHCIAKANRDTTGNSSLSSTTASYQKVVRNSYSTTEDKQISDRYTFNSSLPAYFSTYKVTSKLETIKKEDNTVTSTKNFTGTLVTTTDITLNLRYQDYTSATFCVVESSSSYAIPYTLNCAPAPSDFNKDELCRVSLDTNNCSF